MITPTDAIKKAFQQYAVFRGRATHAEFWWWILFITVSSVALGIVDAIVELATGAGYDILTGLFALATILPGLAVTCRRLHDIGKSGWWQLAWHISPMLAWLAAAATFVFAYAAGVFSADRETEAALPSLTPFFVALIIAAIISPGIIIWAVIWMVRPSQPGPNCYGPEPQPAMPDSRLIQ